MPIDSISAPVRLARAMNEFDVAINFFALLTVGANVAFVGLWALVAAGRFHPGAGDLSDRVRTSLGRSGLAIAATVAVVATAGSLELSERLHLTPCTLCWYQRIAMYSAATILFVAAIRRDWGIRPYALTLTLAGPLISVYHYSEQRFPDLDSGTCSAVSPCTFTWVWRYHYVSIPFMALSAFALVTTILIIARPEAPPAAPTQEAP